MEAVEVHPIGKEGRLEFWVKWEGYDQDSNRWEPAEALYNPAVGDYLKARA